MNTSRKPSNDPIISALRAVRDAHARQFDNDLDKIVADYRRKQNEWSLKVVSLRPVPLADDHKAV